MRKEILIEGYTTEEILNLPHEEVEALVLTGQPLIFKVGSAQILGEFRVEGKRLVVELAQIDGGGEGVLPTLWLLVERYAKHQGLDEIEWIIHALNCAKPNPKLRPILERRGFVIRDVLGVGQAYYQLHPVAKP
jgi:hypothetical protein